MEGRTLHFHLVGLNNQNFVMADEETGTWWQQVSGAAILGPLKGRRLTRVFHDEVTFATWRGEHPDTRVLAPDPIRKQAYAPANWEERIGALPVARPPDPANRLPERALIAGITLGEESRAYLVADVARSGAINDVLGGKPIVLVAGDGGKSIRAFERTVESMVTVLYARPGEGPLRLFDSETGSDWDFTGQAVSGPLAGKQLLRVELLLDFWFDWRTYHPDTDVYAAGRSSGSLDDLPSPPLGGEEPADPPEPGP